MLTPRLLSRFETEGLVTFDGPFSPEQIAAANSAVDDIFPEDEEFFIGCAIYEPGLLALVESPFFEDLAKQVLRTDSVELASVALRKTLPKPDEEFRYEWWHVDFKCSSEDLQASPRRTLCSCLVWLTEVTEDTFPFYFRPGSHLQVARHTDLHPESDTHEYHQEAPDLPYSDPVAVLASAGQVSLVAGPLVHSGSVTPGQRQRRVLFVEYKARGTDFEYYGQVSDLMQTYLESLRDYLDPSRLHVLPS